jgi:hypothetical protein
MEPVFRPFTGRIKEEEQTTQQEPQFTPFQGTLRGAPPQEQSRAPFRDTQQQQATPPEFQPQQQQPQGQSAAPYESGAFLIRPSLSLRPRLKAPVVLARWSSRLPACRCTTI